MKLYWLLLVWCALTRPTSCRAPRDWYVNGVRPNGVFELRPVLGRPEDDLKDADELRQLDDGARFIGRVYCTGGSTPRQNGRKVWCQR